VNPVSFSEGNNETGFRLLLLERDFYEAEIYLLALGLLISLFLQESSITAGNTGDGDPSVARIYVLIPCSFRRLVQDAVGNSGIYRIRYTDLQAMGSIWLPGAQEYTLSMGMEAECCRKQLHCPSR
jgi:hypothetical protein